MQSDSTNVWKPFDQALEAQSCYLYQSQRWFTARYLAQIWCHSVRNSSSMGKRKLIPSSMPTFMIFRNSTVIETIRGADARKLTSAIENAVRNAGPAKPTYSSVGRTLGGTPANGTRLAKPWNVTGFVQAITSFIGLYLVSLFSVSPTPWDAYFHIADDGCPVGRIFCCRKEPLQYPSSRNAETERRWAEQKIRGSN